MENSIVPFGNAVQGVTYIHQQNINATLNDIKVHLNKLDISDDKWSPLGSTGKKSLGQSSGDIDIGIETDLDIDVISNKILSYFQSLNYPISKIWKRGMIHIGFPINNTDQLQPNSLIQVDFMLDTSIDWLKFRFFSPTTEQSDYKGACRNIIFSAFVKFYNLVLFDINNLPNTYQQYVYNNHQVDLVVKSKIGINGNMCKLYKIIKRNLYSNNPNDIIKKFIGTKYSIHDINSFEQLWEILINSNYYNKVLPYMVQDMINGIKKEGCLIPQVLLNYYQANLTSNIV